MPAFLAARDQQSKEIAQGEFGWSTRFPLKWNTLPEVNIDNEDIIKFLQGTFVGQIFVTKNLTKFTYGADLQITHRGFESTFIRDRTDLLGITYYLL
jgi:hypothetical protein